MKLQLSTFILAAVASISAAAAWAPPSRPVSIFASTVNERTKSSSRSGIATQRFSTRTDNQQQQQGQVKPATPQETEEVYELFELPTAKPKLEVSIPTIASVFAATVGTFVLNNYLGMGPVRASSVAGLVATLVLPEKLAIAAFCGTFAGMATTAVIPGVAGSTVLGLVCASMITLFDHKKWLVGVGGRLGFIAQCACTLQFVVSSLFLTPTAPATLVGKVPLDFRSLTLQLPVVASFTVLGAVFMRLWKQVLADKSKRLSNSVGAVGATGLLANLILPAAMAGPAFCGSFVAMAAPTKLPTWKSLIVASLLAGAAQQSLAGVLLGGWGGKLGTAALMGVLGYTLLTDKISSLRQSQPVVEQDNKKLQSQPQTAASAPRPRSIPQ